MATIKEGYGGKPTYISVDTSAGGDMTIGLNIDQKGVTTKYTYPKRVPIEGLIEVDQNGKRYVKTNQTITTDGKETLAYMTLVEAISLRDELNVAIKEMAGV